MPKIIVEICQNHNGDRNILRDLIWSAKENGADIVKGQIIFSEDLPKRERFEEGVVEHNGVIKAIKRPYEAEFERLKKLDLAESDYHFFVEEAKRAGIMPMFTVFSRNRILFASNLSLPEKIVKVASYDCASHKMIEELSDNFDNLIISTGATFDGEIQKTAEILKNKNKNFSFLHCVTSYPNTLAMTNLSRMDWLRQFADNVGWSDHTLVERDGIKASKTALMLGADFIERHYTILPKDKTKDGPISIGPSQLHELADFAKLEKKEQKEIVEKEVPEWRVMLGQTQRELTHTEMLNRDYYRGRFASFVNNKWIFNWETEQL